MTCSGRSLVNYMNQMNQIEINKIICADSLEHTKFLPSNLFDLVIFSPPYANKRYKEYSSVEPEEYPDWLYNFSVELMRVLKDSGSFVLNIKEGTLNGKKQSYVLEYLLKMSKAGWWTETFIWNKTNAYPSGSKKRLKDGFEYCYHFTKTNEYKFFPNNVLVPANPKWIKDNLKRKNKGTHNVNNGSGMNMAVRTVSEMARPSNVITLATNTTNVSHPATFPIGLPDFFIRLMTEENDIVFDPFMGSGTTALACMKNNRNFFGIDNKQEYVNLANGRIDKWTKELQM